MSASAAPEETGKWEAVIGLEVHVQLDTLSKSFSASAVRFGAPPNTLVDPTVMGLPGALPVFNEKGLRYAISLGLALGCTIRRDSRFARKHYFYPDSPKGYQISQFEEPICEGGRVVLMRESGAHEVALTRIHLEDDAGKNTHIGGGTSLVDLNRAGVTLCEIVSEPVIRSAKEAADYMRSLRQVVRYIGVSSGDMEKGQLRCDANVSIRPRGQKELGTRAELKNINSFKFVEKAIEHEIARQISVLENGESVVQETRLWDSDAGVSRSMRSKEEAMDYRYFPDPDLPPLIVSDETVQEIGAALPELPAPACQRLVDLGLPFEDAANLSAEAATLHYFDQTLDALGRSKGKDKGQSKGKGSAKLVSNWIQGELFRELNRSGVEIEDSPIPPAALAGLLRLIDDDTISGKIAKGVLDTMFKSGAAGENSAAEIVEREGLVQITDTGALETVIDELLAKNESQAQKYREGNKKMLGYFVGQVMKATSGQANPKIVNEILQKKLSE